MNFSNIIRIAVKKERTFPCEINLMFSHILHTLFLPDWHQCVGTIRPTSNWSLTLESVVVSHFLRSDPRWSKLDCDGSRCNLYSGWSHINPTRMISATSKSKFYRLIGDTSLTISPTVGLLLLGWGRVLFNTLKSIHPGFTFSLRKMSLSRTANRATQLFL